MPEKRKLETIGETFLRREVWNCDDCQSTFELGAALFDQYSGIICPKCKSKHIGPERKETAAN